jgi:hypothetical protein
MGFDLAGKAAVKRVRQNSGIIVTARIKARAQRLLRVTSWGEAGRFCYYTMDLLLSKSVRLTSGEAIVIILVCLLIWFAGYMTGAEVTLIREKARIIYDCIFLPAPENSSRV